jgi:protein-S-isoprenylcysteine O-methyltransferase Ste14
MTQPTSHLADPDRSKPAALRSALDAVPLSVRMAVYGAAFLAGILVGLPWLAYRVDVNFPQFRVDLGIAGTVIGWTLLAVFVICYLASSYVLTRYGRGAYVEFDPPKQFVATGPYRWVRNPVAACVVAALLAEAIALSSTGIFLLFVAAMGLAHAQVVLMEEPLLRKRFGQDYIDYLSRVPRWIPRRPTASAA